MSRGTPDISVIVPIYNVEEYLKDCIDSVLASKGQFTMQIILIDDGSTDRSSAIAKQYADKYEFVQYYHKENAGLGAARNDGVTHAEGRYIVFIDSDDIIVDDMLENLYESAELFNTDFSLCDVVRFDSTKVWNSGLHQKLFRNIPAHNPTNIYENHVFFYDTISCNKLIRKGFWDKNGFRFPEGILYEDIPVTIPMHLRAEKVSVVKKPGYYWRVRDGKTKSITQMGDPFRNLRDRLQVLEMVYDYLDRHVRNKELRDAFSQKVLDVDLMIFVNGLRKNHGIRDESLEKIADFIIKHMDASQLSQLPEQIQSKYDCVLKKDGDRLDKILNDEHYNDYLIDNLDGVGYKLHLPKDLYGEPSFDIKNEVRTERPHSYIDQISFDNNEIVINSHLFYNRISISSKDQIKVTAQLVNNQTSKGADLKVIQYDSCYITKLREHAGEHNYNYDGACYRFFITGADLCKCECGEYHILIHYKHELFEGYEVLQGMSEHDSEYIRCICQISGGRKGVLKTDQSKRLYYCVTESIKKADAVSKVAFDALRIEANDERLLADAYAVPNECFSRIIKHTGKVALVFKTEEASKANRQLYYINRYTGGTEILGEWKPVDRDKAEISIDFSNVNLASNLYNGARKLFLGNAQERTTEPVTFDNAFFYEYVSNLIHVLVFSDAHNNLMLWVWERQDELEKKRHDTGTDYHEYLKDPVNEKCILFESMWGQKCDCNPRALYEYIDKMYPEYTCVWSLVDERIPITGRGIRVRRGSPVYYYYLATAKYLVNNVNFEDQFIKRPEQVMIETMHGTPYKTLGLDVIDEFESKNSVWKYIRKNQNWDYLIVQGKFMEDMAWRMFRYHNEILKTGYPRTDTIANTSREQKERLRRKLGLPQDKKLILYAPTWRVNNQFDFALSFKELKDALSDQYVMGVRVHHLAAKHYELPADNQFLFDLTSYASIEELYTIADIMITDYSSAMFDYSITKKPMIFYVYDFEDYKERLRGVYFDLETEAPGPLVYNQQQLQDTILNIDTELMKVESRIEHFRNKYLTYETVDSCKLVFEKAILHGKKQKPANKKRIRKLMESYAEKLWIHGVTYKETRKLPRL